MTTAEFPETYIAAFAFLLNGMPETIHALLFVFDRQSSLFHLSGCLLFFSGIDAMMTLSAFWIASVAATGTRGSRAAK